MRSFALRFALVLLALFAFELTPPGQALVRPWTAFVASASSSLIQAFDGDAMARGIVLYSQKSGFAVSIEAGCNGIEAMLVLVLVAGMLAYPARWRQREELGLALRAFAWLPVTLAAWYFASHILAWAPSQLAAPAMSLAGVNAKVARLSDGVAVFEARLQPPYRPGIAAVEEVEAAVEVKTRTFTFGIALFLALSFALGRPWRPGPMAVGAAILVVLPAWGIAFDALRQLAGVASLGPVLAWPPALREAVAFGYQAGSLLLPTLGPVVLWVALDPRVTRGRSEEDQPGRQ